MALLRKTHAAPYQRSRLTALSGLGPAAQRVGLHVALIGLLLSLGLALRWPAADVNSFRNEDVAGITYNADLLARGGVPMVDNLEYKAPGAFFVTWAVFEVGGRNVRTLERFGIFWALLAGVGVYVGGCLLFGTPSALLAGLLYIVWSPITDSITVNYNTWMMTAYIWSTVLFVAGLKRGGLPWLVASGALLAFAGLLKRQGGVLAPVMLVVLALGPLLQRPSSWAEPRRWRELVAFCGGMALGFLPITVFYAVKAGWDGLVALVDHFFFSSAGWRYVGGEIDWSGKLDRLEDGLLGLWEFMALPTLLATMTLAAAPLGRERGWSVRGVLLAGHFFLSFVGLSLGFRFYMGYYLQVLPAAVWLAAHPDGPLLRWFRPGDWPDRLWPAASRLALLACVVLACVPAALADAGDMKKVRRHRKRFNAYQLEAERIAKLVRDNTRRSDSIWIWGRWAWPIYFHADRPSCTPYYKVLGVITTNLDNTWKRPTRMTRFNHKGPWREIAAQLARCKPAFIVTANNETYAGWKPFERLLADAYERVPRFHARSFRVYHRKGLRMKPPHAKSKAPGRVLPRLKRIEPLRSGRMARPAARLQTAVPGGGKATGASRKPSRKPSR